MHLWANSLKGKFEHLWLIMLVITATPLSISLLSVLCLVGCFGFDCLHLVWPWPWSN